jgi:uncharacterized protein
MTVTVIDHPERDRYEISDGAAVVGFVEYRRHGDEIAILHTEIGDEFGGRGFGGQLIRAVLDDAKASGRRVVPYCPFTRSWIATHPEYVELVPETHRRLVQPSESTEDS